uniref:Uncharacterized protein n=1 Tax=Mucochytrium quahogii TaxID=96639 RepID=A0A7S2S324_9STRA|mmetsp:Transcript_10839/g.17743  ORF Transcript_10839/g.17743 Transcript_10839/m.17743 type:complete len:166 (+) Transcript_10839:376-873(+)
MCLRPDREYEQIPPLEYSTYPLAQEVETDGNECDQLVDIHQQDLSFQRFLDDVLSPVSPLQEDISSLVPASSAIITLATTSCKPREIQFCSVCCGVRRHAGRFVNGHDSSSYCPAQNRFATKEDKRELRRIRQKIRRKVSKQNTTNLSPLPQGLPTCQPSAVLCF